MTKTKEFPVDNGLRACEDGCMNLCIATYNKSDGHTYSSEAFLGVFDDETKAMQHCARLIDDPTGDQFWCWNLTQDECTWKFAIDSDSCYVVRPVVLNIGEQP